MTQRYFAETPITTDQVVLAGSEAHHLLHVMRASIGQQVTLFDGSGSEFVATVAKLGRADAQLEINSREEIDRELSLNLTLAVSLPKGEHQRWLVEKAVEIGVNALIPIITERSVANPSEKALAKLRRGVIEASKQCRRNRLMRIEPAVAFDDLLSSMPDDDMRMIAHPSTSNTVAKIIRDNPPQIVKGSVSIAIGPEGGFTDAEFSMAQNQGWECVTLGKRILRTETAAIFLASAVIANMAY